MVGAAITAKAIDNVSPRPSLRLDPCMGRDAGGATAACVRRRHLLDAGPTPSVREAAADGL